MTFSVYKSPVCKVVACDVPQAPLCQSPVTGTGLTGGYDFYDQYEGGME